MQLDSLAITNFKNIAEARLEFSGKINCLLGNNGMGKSNLLDAIYCLSFTKSFSGLTDLQLIRRGEAFATLRGLYTRRGADEELTMGLQPGRRKSFRRKGKEYDRLSAHIGAFPLVLVSPADGELITGTSDGRRRLMDQVKPRPTRYISTHSYATATPFSNATACCATAAWTTTSIRPWKYRWRPPRP